MTQHENRATTLTQIQPLGSLLHSPGVYMQQNCQKLNYRQFLSYTTKQQSINKDLWQVVSVDIVGVSI